MTSKKDKFVLHRAIKRNKTDVLQFLLNNETEFNLQNELGDTPLHVAVRRGKINIIKQLIGKNVNVNIQNHEGNTPLHMALKVVPISFEMNIITIVIANILLNKDADVNIKNKMGNTPLHLAIESCKTAVANLLLERGAEVSVQNQDGNTPVHLAAIKNRKRDVPLHLLEREVDYNIQNRKGETPLHLSLKHKAEIKTQLLERSDLNIQNHEGDTPLHVAYKYSDMNVITQIYEKGANIKIGNKEGDTPLHLAFKHDKINLVSLRRLVELGADLGVQNNEGNTPVHLAFLYCDSYQGIAILLDKNMIEHEQIVNELILSGASLNVQNCRGETPLFFAACSGYSCEVMKRLLEKVADVYHETANGDTLLHYAAISNNVDTVKFLADQSININKQNVDGNTPLHCAGLSQSFSVEELILKGADVLIKNREGKTSFDISPENSYSRFVIGEHIIGLQVAGLITDIPQNIFELYGNSKVFDHHKSSCILELEKLRNIKLSNGFSLSHLVSRYRTKTCKLPYYLNEDGLKTKLEEFCDRSHSDLKSKFPCYWLILKSAFDSEKKIFQTWQCWKSVWNLPDLPTEQILNNLTTSDIGNFLKSLSF